MEDADRLTCLSDDGLDSGRKRPFVGTRPFSAADSVFFFGRDREAIRLANLVVASTLTVLYGDSGVGKSSLINAKLPEALTAIEPDWLLISFSEWQADCLQRIEQTIENAIGLPVTDSLAKSLLVFANKEQRPVLLVLDQFEEYFLYHPQGLSALDAELAKLVNRRVSRVSILLSLRNDGLSLLDRLRLRIPHIFGSMMSIEPLERTAAIECVVRPLERYNQLEGVTTIEVPQKDSDLVKALLSGAEEQRILSSLPGRGRSESETGDQGSTRIVAPFLQMALDALWEKDVVNLHHRRLELATLRLLAELPDGAESQAVGAIAQKYVDSILREFSNAEKAVCAAFFERMVLPSGQKVAVKLPDLSAALIDDRQKGLAVSLLARLSADETRRLIKMVAGPKDTEPHYQIVHDAMAIPVLGWVARWKADEQAARARKKGAAIAAALAVLAVVALFAWGYFREVTAQQVQNENDRVITSGLRPEETRIYSLRTALDALKSGLTKYGTVWASLQKVYELYRFEATNQGDGGQIHAADFAPDGKSVLAIDLGGKLYQWAIGPERKMLRELAIGPRDASGRPAEGRSLRISPLGDVAAVGFSDGSVVLVDLKSAGSNPAELKINGTKPHASRAPGGFSSVFGLVFSSDGSLLVTSSRAGNVAIWERHQSDLSPNDTLGWRLRNNIDLNGLKTADIWAVDLDPTKQAIAVGLDDGRVCLLWLDDPGDQKCSRDGHAKAVKSVRFKPNQPNQPNQPILVSAGNDAKVTIWNVDWPTRQLHSWPIPLFQDNSIWDLDFSRNGSLLATSSWDGSVRIYQTATWRLLNTVAADKVRLMRSERKAAGADEATFFALRTVRFNITSNQLLTASLDHTARVWSPVFDRTSALDLSYRLVPIGTNSVRPIRSVALASTGKRIAFIDREDIYLRSFGEEPRRLPSPDEHAQQALKFSRVLMSSDKEVVATAVQSRLAVWIESSDGTWQPHSIALPGDAIPDGRGIAIDDEHSVLGIELREGDRASILLCQLRRNEPESTCARAGNATIEHLPLGIDVKPYGCAYQAQAAIAISKSGRLIAAAAGGCPIEVFDRENKKAPRQYAVGEDFSLTSLDFSPDEKSLVATSANNQKPEVRIWNLADGSSRNINHHFSPNISAARYSPSGLWIISGSNDNNIVVSSAQTGEQLVALSYRNSLLALDIVSTPRGVLLATGSEGGEINVMRFFGNAKEISSYAEAVLQDVSQ